MEYVGDRTIEEESESRSEEDIEEEVGQVAQSRAGALSPAEQSALVEAQSEVNQLNLDIDAEFEANVATDRVETNYHDLGPAADSDTFAKKCKAEAVELKAATATQSRPSRRISLRMGVALLLGVSTAAGLVIKIIKQSQTPAADDSDAIKKLVDQFRAEPETAFWKRVADYVDEKAPGRQAQSMLMAYTKLLAGEKITVPWKDNEKGDLIAALLAARDKAGKDSELYRTVATLKHDGVDLTRGARADLCELAVASLWARKH